MVRQGQGDQPIASEFVRTDWATVARGYGCVGLQVSRPEDIQSLGSDSSKLASAFSRVLLSRA